MAHALPYPLAKSKHHRQRKPGDAMPTIVTEANRKLTYRRRVRLTKAEEKSLQAFLTALEDHAKRGHGPESFKDTIECARTGAEYLGRGVFKSAYALPGGRWVVKVPRTRDFMSNLKDAGVEADMYNAATPELRQHLANTRRSPRPWATVQERAPRTVQKVKDTGTPDERRSIGTKYNEFVDMLSKQFKFAGDLHEQNIAVREDGTLCAIDFALVHNVAGRKF